MAIEGLSTRLMAGCCLVGAIVAVAMRRPTGHRRRRGLLLAVAWCFAVTMILVIPDIRLLQNLAYALMLAFVKLDWRVLYQGVIVLGGALITGWGTWAPGWLWPFWGIALGMATIAYYHRRRDPHRQGRGLWRGSPR